jgi:hypothetical protein
MRRPAAGFNGRVPNMIRMLSLILLLVLVAIPAAAQDRNLVALVHDLDCELVTNQADNPCFTQLYCGMHEIPLIIYNPWNDALDQPIATVGGFELKLVLPPEVMLLGVQLPPASYNYKALPELYVGGWIPVTGEKTVMAMVNVYVPEYVGTTVFARITPVHVTYQSIPGRLAITDGDDGFSLQAVDAIGPKGVTDDYEDPMFYFGDPHGMGSPCVVSSAEETWGGIKAQYR